MEECHEDQKALTGADFITVACYKERRWLEVRVGLGSIGVIVVDGKDTKFYILKDIL